MDSFLRTRIDSEVLDRYKAYCKDKDVSVSDDLRSYIMSVIGFTPAEKSCSALEETSGVEDIDPDTGFRKRVQFTPKGLILHPKTPAEKEYNRALIA